MKSFLLSLVLLINGSFGFENPLCALNFIPSTLCVSSSVKPSIGQSSLEPTYLSSKGLSRPFTGSSSSSSSSSSFESNPKASDSASAFSQNALSFESNPTSAYAPVLNPRFPQSSFEISPVASDILTRPSLGAQYYKQGLAAPAVY